MAHNSHVQCSPTFQEQRKSANRRVRGRGCGHDREPEGNG